MTYSLTMPRIIKVGGEVSQQLAELLSSLGLTKPLIVTDRFLQENGHLERLAAPLRRAGIEFGVFAETVPEPTVESINTGLDFVRAGSFDCVVGFGGGSPIDSAKAIAVLAVHGGEPSHYKAPHTQDSVGLPIIAVPTTAGTGSEVTRFTIITDEVHDEKMLCAGLAYLPIAALIDYKLTLTAPPRLTADTGIDALTHAIEAYVSRRANPVSDLFALSAIRLIGPNLRRVWADPENQTARAAMMLGSTKAGIAFSNASVCLVHGMSRPIGAHFHVPHGLSNAMLLPTVTAFSVPSSLQKYADCARQLDLGAAQLGDESLADLLIEELNNLNRDLAVPTPSSFGIDKRKWDATVPLMAEQALASGSPANNPLVPTAKEIETLYSQVWG